MTEVKLEQVGDITPTTSGQLRVVFRDVLNPLTDEDGNPRLTGTVDDDGVPIVEYHTFTETVDPASDLKDDIVAAINAATERVKPRAARAKDEQVKRLKLINKLKIVKLDPATFNGDVVIEPVVPTEPEA